VPIFRLLVTQATPYRHDVFVYCDPQALYAFYGLCQLFEQLLLELSYLFSRIVAAQGFAAQEPST
jgi:hypothetical protein